MHSQIKIRDPILANAEGIKTLYDYTDVLKSTQVILCKEDTYGSKIQCELVTFNTNSNYILLSYRGPISACIMFINFTLRLVKFLKFYLF